MDTAGRRRSQESNRWLRAQTDDLFAYGLGPLPDEPDERDYPLSALYAAEGLTPTTALPVTYAAPGMPPVLDQHATPMCAAHSSSALKAWQDRRDQEPTPSAVAAGLGEASSRASAGYGRGERI
jgi:hypothetical protein